MKTVTVVLTQEPKPGLFRVQSFTNTVQVSVGQLIPATKVAEWCTIPRVNIRVTGLTQPDPEQEQTTLSDGDGVRHDALSMEGCS